MKTRISRSAALAFVTLSLLAACAPVSQYVPSNAPAAVAPTVRAGDFWEYTVRDAYSGVPRGLYRHVVARADSDATVVDIYRDGQRVDAFVYAAGWNPREMPLTNLQRFRYDPPFPSYEYPLIPGKSWNTAVNATYPATRKTYRVHVQARVLGWERLHVAAGDFDALKVVRYVFAGNAEFFNLQEEIIQIDWYSPAVRQVVRSEARSSHVDTSRSGGGRGRPLVVHGDWLVAELVRYSPH